MMPRIRDALDAESVEETPIPGDLAAGDDVGRGTRAVSALVGGALLVFGVRRRTVPGTAVAFVGGWLLHRSIPGRSPLPDVFGGDAEGEIPEDETE